ncbi:COG1361 S-layer family protein [Gorillibacterium massiliense]|uniref:COG1361 S-layer family protein n=1 Tax=Gorillibacterium massiliense TaxID=1280390 RepID=UPI0004B286E9|nr:CARDB domain-containing protein [Gorillibacterium massiliense]
MRRKYAAAMMALIFLLMYATSGISHAAETTDLISGKKIIKGNTSKIVENDKFTLRLYFSKDIESINLEINDTSSFYGEDSNIFQFKKGTGSIEAALPLVYSGYGNYLYLSGSWSTATESGQFRQNLYISEAVPTKSEPTPVPTIPPLPDTTKYIPKLGVSGNTAIPTGFAGDTLNLTLPIRNSTGNSARDVSISLEPEDKSKVPYETALTNVAQSLDSIDGKVTKTVVFPLKIKADMPSGIYPLKVNYQFNNSFGDPFTSSEGIYIKVENYSTAARLSLGQISTDPKQAVPGETMILRISLANAGSTAAKDVKLTLTGLKSDGFTLNSSSDTKRIGQINGNQSDEETFQLSVSSAITGGSQPLGVKWEYKDNSGNPVTEESQIFIPVKKGPASAAAVSIGKITAPGAPLIPKSSFTINFDVTNGGKEEANNIKVTVASDKELVPTSLSNVMIPALAPGKSQSLSFAMKVAPDAPTKSYPIAITVEYEEMEAGQPVKKTLTQYVGVYVEGADKDEDKDSKTVPRIIVNQYSIDPATVMAGQNFTLNLSFLNTSRLKDVSNLKLSVASDDGTFTFDGSSTFFVEAMPSKGAVEKTLTLRPKPDADAKIYNVTLNFEYEDAKGNPYTSKETVSIPVQQNNRLVAGEVNVLSEAFTGQPIPISLEFYNMGKSILYNLMVSTEGNFTSANNSYYVGNFASGRSDSFESSLIPNEAGELKGTMIFTYEDSAGKSSEYRKEFSIMVNDMPPAEPVPGGDQPMNPAEPGKNKWKKALYIGIPALVLLGGTAAVIIKKKRRKKKEMELDE